MAVKYPNTLTRVEIENAIWLDFEGLHYSAPSFAGTVIDDNFQFNILNNELEMLKNSRMGLSYYEYSDFSEDLVEKAISENRVVVGYSEHEYNELNKISDYCSDNMKNLYRNANLLTKSFFRDNRKQTYLKLNEMAKERGNKIGLKDYLKLDYVRYKYPDEFADFKPSSAIANLLSQCSKKSTYSRMSTPSKERLKLLIQYNEHDCRGMKHLVEYIFSRNPSLDELSH